MSVLALSARTEVTDWDTNAVTQYWESKTGIHIEWEVITDGAASKQKLGVIMASGELPDVIMSAGSTFSQDQAVSYGSQGLIIALNDLIDTYGVNTKKLFEYDPLAEKAITTPDGSIYFLPSYTSNEMAHTGMVQKCLVNTDWLERLDLKIPTTTEDFYNILVAFRDQDANGNGNAQDEIPLVTYANNFDTFLMNSFQYNSGLAYNRLMVEAGTVMASYVQPGWQEGLKYMKRLYEENLADKEIFLANDAQLKLYTGDANGNRVGACLTYAYSRFIDISTPVVNEFTFIEPLIGPTGLQQTPYVKSIIYPTFFITKNCAFPDLAFRWGDAKLVDALADPTLIEMNGMYGPENEGWAKATADEKGLDGKTPAAYKWLFTWGQPNNLNWHEYSIGFRRGDWKLLMATTQGTWNQEVILFNVTQELYKPYATEKNVPNTLIFDAEAVSEVGQLKTVINDYVNESISKFVTGAMDIEQDWDKYLSELNKMGLERFITLHQEAYAGQFGN
jgi:putative aldouronate transport system substrate-binding protein